MNSTLRRMMACQFAIFGLCAALFAADPVDDALSVKTAVNTVFRGRDAAPGMPVFGAPNLPTPASGYSDSQLVGIFEKIGVPNAKPDPGALAVAVGNYARLQELHANGAISNEVFQNCMKTHFDAVNKIYQSSALPGTQITTQMGGGGFKLFSDGDFHVVKADGSQLSFDEFMKLQENINKNFSDFFEKAKVPIDPNSNFNQLVNADVMLKDPSKLPPAQQALYNQWMDQFGGVLYKNGQAIEMEGLSRLVKDLSAKANAGDAAARAQLDQILTRITPEKAAAYANEVLKHADDFVNAGRMLREQAAAMADGAAKTRLLNQANVCDALASKYVERVNNSASMLAAAQKVEPPNVSGASQEIIERAGKRTAETLQDAAEFGANYQRLRQEAVENVAKTIDDVAKARPEIAQACQDASQSLSKTMSDAAHGSNLPGSALPNPPGPQPGRLFATPEQFLAVNRALGVAGVILTVFDAYDIVKDLYNKQWLSAGFRGFVVYGTTKLGTAAAPYIAGAYAAHPVVVTGVLVFATSYALTRQAMERLGLDAPAQRFMADHLFGASKVDAAALQEISRQFQSALDKGHRPANGMTVDQAWQRVVDNYNKGGRIYTGVFASPGTSSGRSLIQNSSLVSEFEGRMKASNGSKINAGIKAGGATVRDSSISTFTKGSLTADSKSDINTGVRIEGAKVTGKSSLSTHTEGRITAKDASTVNTGIDANGATIKGSTISTFNKADITATGKSSVNTGVQAKDATITDSKISTLNTGRITASDKSSVNTGVQAKGAKITDSKITIENTGDIKATKGSKVNTGLKLDEEDDSHALPDGFSGF